MLETAGMDMANPGSSNVSPADYERKVRISSALTALWLKVAHRAGEITDIEDRISLYAEQLMTWPERVVFAALAEHPKRSIYWPAWKELEDIRGDLESAERDRRLALPAPGEHETFAAQVTRLGLHRRLGDIGVSRWRDLLRQRLTDQALLDAVKRLEAGRRAFDDDDTAALFTKRREWQEFLGALNALRDASVPIIARDPLLKIGEKIEGRQRPNAEANGWA